MDLKKLSIVIPARDEEGSIEKTVRSLFSTLKLNNVPHEILVVDDGSTDKTWCLLRDLMNDISTLAPIQNTGDNGFGMAIRYGLDQMTGDAVVIMMADLSDDPQDVVKYWQILNSGYECVFGSRFIFGSAVHNYPKIKLWINRLANFLVMILFKIRLNDTTNAFKAYRRDVIDGCRPILSPHFNITVELPLKAIVRGYYWTVIPISWRNREAGTSKLKIKEMGSRYFFICAYLWLEKYFSRGDYRRMD